MKPTRQPRIPRAIRTTVVACSLTCGLVGTLIGTTAAAQSFPADQKPVTLIVPYGPGTGIDLVTRILGNRLAEVWKSPVVVRNLPGASGAIGATATAQAKPDGYTFGMIANSHIINQFVAKNVVDIQKAFDPVAPGGTLPYLIAISTTLPPRSLRELVALAKTRPGEINYSGLSGSVPHLLGAALQAAGEIDIKLIPYKSTTDAIPDIIAGRVPIWFTTVASGVPMVQKGSVRALAVTGDKRSNVLPDVPSVVEAGFPTLNLGSSFYLLAPAGTPRAIITRVNAEMRAAMGHAEVRDKLAGQGVEPQVGTPEELAATLQAEVTRFAAAIKTSGIANEK